MRTRKVYTAEPAIPRLWGATLACAEGRHSAEFSVTFCDEPNRTVDYCADHLAECFENIQLGRARVEWYRAVLNPRAFIS
jgi:hypothetical protein